MAVEVKITKQLNEDFVQVESYDKNRKPRYFQVPIQTADRFCHQLKETENKTNIRNNIVFAASAIGGCGLGNIIMLKQKPIIRTITAVVTGILAGFVTNNICLNKTNTEIRNVLRNNRAVDITKYLRDTK